MKLDRKRSAALAAVLCLGAAPLSAQVVSRGGQAVAPAAVAPVPALNSVGAPLISDAFKTPAFFNSLLNEAGLSPSLMGPARLNFASGAEADGMPAAAIPAMTENYWQAANDVSIAPAAPAQTPLIPQRHLPPPTAPAKPLIQSIALKVAAVSGLLKVVPDLALASSEYTESLGRKVYDALYGGGGGASSQPSLPSSAPRWADRGPSGSGSGSLPRTQDGAAPDPSADASPAPEFTAGRIVRMEPPAPASPEAPRSKTTAAHFFPETVAAEGRSSWGLRLAPAFSAPDRAAQRPSAEMPVKSAVDAVALVTMQVERQRLRLSQSPAPAAAPSAAFEPNVYSLLNAVAPAAHEAAAQSSPAPALAPKAGAVEKEASRPLAVSSQRGSMLEIDFLDGTTGLSRTSLLMFAFLPLLALGLIRPR